MSLNRTELADIVAELSPRLKGARLERINATSPRACQLIFRSGEGNRILLLDLTPGRTRLHLQEEKRPGLPTPPAWVMKCRKELAGTFLTELRKEASDRVVCLVFRGSKHSDWQLVAELFDRQGRLLLLDQHGAVAFALIGKAKAGEPYHPPVSARVAPTTPSRFPPADPSALAANFAVSEHYQKAEEETALEQRRKLLSRRIGKEHRRLSHRLDKLKADLERTAVADELSRKGETLKANLSKLARGQRKVTLVDLFGEPLVLDLDPALDPVENMKRLFDKSRRLGAARPQIEARIKKTQSPLEELANLVTELDGADSESRLKEIEERLAQAGFPPTGKKPEREPRRRRPYRTYRSATGKRILVGRSGRDNHELTFRVARGSYLWLHARDAPGAHVVVCLEKGEQVDQQTLLDAATLAAARSGWKQDEKVEVTYTRVKDVHPIKRGPPGQVSLARGRTILVRIESERMERLKQTFEI